MLGNGGAYGIPGWGNNELQYYRSENATVANGALTITARQENFAGYNYTSARLRTRNLGDWKYGRFEMRAKLPVTQGMWPAFWMLPTDEVYGGWAASGEIDIMESLGHEPERIYGTIHYGGSYPENTFSGNTTWLAPNSATDFHVYAIEWEEGEIRWYVDGQLYSTKTDWYSSGIPFPAPFDQRFHLLLNVAVGGNFPGNPDGSTVLPQEYIIDYVRVYQLAVDVDPPLAVFDDLEHGDPFGNGWFAFEGGVGGGGIDANFSDLPPADGGIASLQTGWGSGGTPGYMGGFGRNNPITLTPNLTEFTFWINPDPGNYRLEINLQEDENADGQFNQAVDEEFQYNCEISATGPCAIAGGGWQKITVPLTDFYDDNSYATGGNGILDAGGGSSGQLINMVISIISNDGAAVTFRTDYWAFVGQIADGDGDAIADIVDNCVLVANSSQTDSDGDNIGNACDTDVAVPNDCTTDLLDLAAYRENFLLSGSLPTDNNDDGTTDLSDLAIVRSYFLSAPGPSALPNDCDGL